ncbi:MAG: DUF6057 family protein [Bacteroidales bacterium]|jgi:hypothetical protein
MSEKRTPLRVLNTAFIILFAVAVTGFFGIFYQYHLLYTEGMQLFLFTRGYFWDTVLTPGGAADYMSRFLIQFYRAPLLGGAIIALLLSGLGQGIIALTKRLRRGPVYAPLAYVPPVIYWILLCNPNFTLAGPVALTAAVWIVCLFSAIGNDRKRSLFGFLALPVLWFLFGGVVFPALVLMVVASWILTGKKNLFSVFFPVLSLAVIFLYVLFADMQRPSADLFYGAVFHKFKPYPHLIFAALWTSVPVALAGALLIKNRSRMLSALMILTIAGTAFWGIRASYRGNKEQELSYLFSARRMDWHKILARSGKNMPNSLLSLQTVNLALAVTGQAGDMMFTFPQTPGNALILPEDGDMLFSSEIWFNLGMVNEARRYAYESMMALPDRQRSGFFLMRLAETNMLAGKYILAEKYLNVLMHAPFYRTWAKKRLDLCRNTEKIAAHPVYGPLRKRLPSGNIRVTAGDFTATLLNILADNPGNDVARTYWYMDRLLHKDVAGFCENYVPESSPLPRHYQEVLLLACRLGGTEPDSLSLPLDRGVKDDMEHFFASLQTSGMEMMDTNFGKTYWYYAYFVQ